MAIEITIPSPGESITEVMVGPWHKQSGEWVEKDEIVVEIESDKVTLEVPAPEAGVLSIAADEGAEMNVGEAVGSIDTSAERPAGATPKAVSAAVAGGNGSATTATAIVPPSTAPAEGDGHRATSVARKMAADKGVNLGGVQGTGPSGRVTKADVMAAAATPTDSSSLPPRPAATGERGVRRERMSRLRRRIAERLVSAQQTAAMLTTFNEADMSAVMALRKRHKEAFKDRHGVGLGFMSFFVKACVSALQSFPAVNAFIDGDEIEYHDFVDISIAVGTDKGLVVPVIRNAETLSFAGIEQTIVDLATRARAGQLTMDDMSGGTFTITNGGVYGSMMSTPILNPPQSAILGMHNIINRPVADSDNPGEMVLRPMMYLAVSYDHRVIDGEQAVRFLVHVKQCLESPDRLLLEV